MNVVPDLIGHACTHFANRAAVICDHRALTFAEVDRRANLLAGALVAHGVESGDRLMLLAMNEACLLYTSDAADD